MLERITLHRSRDVASLQSFFEPFAVADFDNWIGGQ